MKDFFLDLWEKIRTEWRETLKNFGVKVKDKQTVMTEQKTEYEVSLVPDVKREMIKTMKIRNVFLFSCIVVVAAAGIIVAIMISIWEGQNITMSGQDRRIDSMSKKLNDYSSLGEFLTIQDQLGKISEVNTNKKVLSRVFPILGVVLPEGPDKIEISDLSVELSSNVLRFDAQADAKVAPYIDYRVLESFKKSISLMKYDYGRYVTADGAEIPTRCMVEADKDGNTLVEEESNGLVTNRYIYAYWLKGKKGCDPERGDLSADEEAEEAEAEAEKQEANNLQSSNMNSSSSSNSNSGSSSSSSSNSNSNSFLNQFSVTGNNDSENTNDNNSSSSDNNSGENTARKEYEDKLKKMTDYEKELAEQQLLNGAKMENVDVVKIYRSPRFSDWYKEGYIDESGTISGVNHFDSKCITYSGEDSSGVMKWTANNECMLSTEDPIIQDSSNGRSTTGELVLRFTASLTLDPAVFMFENKHVMAISPSGQNVTDSYRQIEGMFAQRASDCSDSDVVCTSTATEGN